MGRRPKTSPRRPPFTFSSKHADDGLSPRSGDNVPNPRAAPVVDSMAVMPSAPWRPPVSRTDQFPRTGNRSRPMIERFFSTSKAYGSSPVSRLPALLALLCGCRGPVTRYRLRSRACFAPPVVQPRPRRKMVPFRGKNPARGSGRDSWVPSAATDETYLHSA